MSVTKERVKKLLPYTIAVDTVKRAPQKMKKLLFANRRMQGAAKSVGDKIGLHRRYLWPSKAKAHGDRKVHWDLVREEVATFLRRPDNAAELPSKKANAGGRRTYSLMDTLTNLHKKYGEETKVDICFSSFCYFRPREVRVIREAKRNVCLCLDCTVCIMHKSVAVQIKNIIKMHVRYR